MSELDYVKVEFYSIKGDDGIVRIVARNQALAGGQQVLIGTVTGKETSFTCKGIESVVKILE